MKSARLRESLHVSYGAWGRSCTVELLMNIDGQFSVSCSIATKSGVGSVKSVVLDVVCLSRSLQSSC